MHLRFHESLSFARGLKRWLRGVVGVFLNSFWCPPRDFDCPPEESELGRNCVEAND